MRNNIIALRMCVSNQEEEFELPTITVRSKKMINNPVSASFSFYRIISKFFQVIVKLPFDTFTGKNMVCDELIKQEINQECGAFGHITAHLGVIEEQTGGNLHYHGMLWGAWNVRAFQQWCHQPKATKIFTELIDSHITCKIPSSLKSKENRHKISLTEAYPNAKTVDLEGAKLASVYNHHKHSSTCWKDGHKKCRLAMPQPKAQETFFTEIIADENGEPVRKFEPDVSGGEIISEPPPRGSNAFSVKDTRIIVSRLARRDEFEKMQVECNLITSALLRCNTSIQILITESQAKAAAFYIAQYMSKQPYSLQNILPLLYQAEQELAQYGSKAQDAGAPKRKGKNVLQKLINKFALLEISDQQATAAALGYDSFLCSHKFTFVEIWSTINKYRAWYAAAADDDNDSHSDYSVDDDEDFDDENEAELLANLEIDTQTQRGISVSSLDRYLYRGDELSKYSLYMYALMIGHRKPLKNKKSINPGQAGRPTNPTFAFKPDSKPAKCFEQIMKSCPTIPRIAGRQPPRYPGDPPEDEEKESKRKAWKIEAKTFVEFYSLLFLPFDENFNLLKPYHLILPWNDETSWNNFWKVFNGFENATNFYQRAVWYIFHNMVDNMRQRSEERKLVTKWRFIAAKQEETTNIESDERRQSNLERTEQSDDENADDMLAIIQQLRDKYSGDMYASPKEKDRRKANQFVKEQVDKYRRLQQADSSQVSIPEEFKKYTLKECKKKITAKLLLKKTQSESDDNDDDVADKPDSEPGHGLREFTYGQNKKEIRLEAFQMKVVNQLKAIKENEVGGADIKQNQLLAFIQGVPGAGKTTTARKLAEKLGLNALFSGTTGTAAAQLNARTINSLLCLGYNTNVANDDLNNRSDAKQKIIHTFENIDLLIIDEVSMLTPVTLTRIDTYLRECLEDQEHLFGGLDVLLIGDMYQFPPVSPGLKKPALYQAAVMLALGLNLPSESYRVGANIFTKFRMVILDGQKRCTPEFAKWLGQLRNSKIEYPITDQWLSQLTTLSQDDFVNEEVNWSDTTVVVSGNLERYRFIKEKIKTVAIKHGQPILKWYCSFKVGKKQYQDLDWNPEDIYPEVVEYFVRGAKCVMTESLNTTMGLGKGAEATLLDVVWEKEEDAVDMDTLEPGEIQLVKQPLFIVVRINNTAISLKPTHKTIQTINNKEMSYLTHNCELAYSVTYHKMQGKTVDRTILSLNSRSNISRKIYPVSLPSLYVGCSRVRNHQALRVLPLSDEDKAYLKTLKWDPYLPMFFENFDETGRWKSDGLREYRQKFVINVKLRLGLIDSLDLLTVEEMKKSAQQLDIIIPKANKRTSLIEKLATAHAEGKKMLNKHNGHLLNVLRLKLLKQLQKQNIATMQLKTLRYFAKRLGVKYQINTSIGDLRKDLQKYIHKQKQCLIMNTNEDVEMTANTEYEMDVEQAEEDVMPVDDDDDSSCDVNMIEYISSDDDDDVTDEEMQSMEMQMDSLDLERKQKEIEIKQLR